MERTAETLVAQREKKRVYDSVYYLEHREAKLARTHELWRMRKIEVLSYYSNQEYPVCLWCGEGRLACLSIDHIDGGGAAERRKVGRSGFYYWLKKQGFPEGYQTLCMNCQFIKEINERSKGQ